MSMEISFDGYLTEYPDSHMRSGCNAININDISCIMTFDCCLTGDPRLNTPMDFEASKVDCEINFNREFFKYQPPRPLAEIDAELAKVEKRIMEMLREVTE